MKKYYSIGAWFATIMYLWPLTMFLIGAIFTLAGAKEHFMGECFLMVGGAMSVLFIPFVLIIRTRRIVVAEDYIAFPRANALINAKLYLGKVRIDFCDLSSIQKLCISNGDLYGAMISSEKKDFWLYIMFMKDGTEIAVRFGEYSKKTIAKILKAIQHNAKIPPFSSDVVDN